MRILWFACRLLHSADFQKTFCQITKELVFHQCSKWLNWYIEGKSTGKQNSTASCLIFQNKPLLEEEKPKLKKEKPEEK